MTSVCSTLEEIFKESIITTKQFGEKGVRLYEFIRAG